MGELTPYDEKALENGALNAEDEDEDDDLYACPGYPEHDYELVDEEDGWQSFHCRRCGAETDERVS